MAPEGKPTGYPPKGSITINLSVSHSLGFLEAHLPRESDSTSISHPVGTHIQPYYFFYYYYHHDGKFRVQWTLSARETRLWRVIDIQCWRQSSIKQKRENSTNLSKEIYAKKFSNNGQESRTGFKSRDIFLSFQVDLKGFLTIFSSPFQDLNHPFRRKNLFFYLLQFLHINLINAG